MTLQATLRSGNPQTINYTPSGGNVTEGDVVVLATVSANNTGQGMTLGIAQHAITNSTLGALAYGGCWNVTAGGNLANWAKVYWDDTNNKVTGTSTNNSLFGYVVDRQSASGDTTNTTITCQCWPFV